MINKLHAIIILFCIIPAVCLHAKDSSAPAREDGSSAINFKNSDLLHGDIISITSADGKVSWRHPDSKTPFVFILKNLKEISLPGTDKPRDPQSSFAVVLTNGDTLKGSISSIDSANLLLKTWYAGELKIDRRMIREIINLGASPLIYSGPGNINEWKVSKESGDKGDADMNSKVESDNGMLILSGYEAYAEKKDAKLPDMARIEYETTIGNDGAGIILFSDISLNAKESNSIDSEIYKLNAYAVNISRQSLNAGRCRNGEWQSAGEMIGEEKLRKVLNSSTKVKVTIYANRKAGILDVHINDRPALRYADMGGEFPKGDGLIYIMTDNSENAPVRISKIRIGIWDGKLPDSAVSGYQADKDTVLFPNNDKTTGTLKSLVQGALLFETEFAQLSIPLERISILVLSSDRRRQAKREINDIKAFFTGDEYVTFSMSDISGGKIKGKSENTGNVVLDIGAFSKISFNIYDEEDNR